MNEWMEQERLLVEMRAIFNDFSEYKFANSNHMEVIIMYGKSGMTFQESLKAASNHAKLSAEFSKVGHFPDDYTMYHMITKGF